MARKKPMDDAPIEVLDDAGGPELGIDFGIIIGTTVVMVAAVIFVMLTLADHYGRGPFA